MQILRVRAYVPLADGGLRARGPPEMEDQGEHGCEGNRTVFQPQDPSGDNPRTAQRAEMPDVIGGKNADAPNEDRQHGNGPEKRQRPEHIPGIDNRGAEKRGGHRPGKGAGRGFGGFSADGECGEPADEQRQGSDELRSGPTFEGGENGIVEAEPLHVGAERTKRNAAVVEKRKIEEHEDGDGQSGVAEAKAFPIEGREHDGEEFHGNREREGGGGSGAQMSCEGESGEQQKKSAKNIDVAASGNFDRQQWVPSESEDPVLWTTDARQKIEEQEDNRYIAKDESEFESKDGLVKGGDGAKEELGSRRIGAGHLGVIQRDGFGGVQRGEGRIVGNKKIWIIPEALDAAIPDVAVDVVIQSRRQAQEEKMPEGGERKAKEEDARRETGSGRELAEGQKVADAGKGEGDEEGGSALVAEVVRADSQRG